MFRRSLSEVSRWEIQTAKRKRQTKPLCVQSRIPGTTETLCSDNPFEDPISSISSTIPLPNRDEMVFYREFIPISDPTAKIFSSQLIDSGVPGDIVEFDDLGRPVGIEGSLNSWQIGKLMRFKR